MKQNCIVLGNDFKSLYQAIGTHVFDYPGPRDRRGIETRMNTLYGEWKFQKDFRYDLYDQMKQMMRRIEALEANMKYDYHYDSNSYSDN